MTGQEVQKDKS